MVDPEAKLEAGATEDNPVAEETRDEDEDGLASTTTRFSYVENSPVSPPASWRPRSCFDDLERREIARAPTSSVLLPPHASVAFPGHGMLHSPGRSVAVSLVATSPQ